MNTSQDPNMSAEEILYEFRNTYNKEGVDSELKFLKKSIFVGQKHIF